MKPCTLCGTSKDLEAFPPDKRRKDGRGSRCRDCHREVSKKDYRNHRAARLAKGREWRQKNPEYYREWRAATPEQQREYRARRDETDPERHRRYYLANTAKHSARVTEWRASNPEKVRAYVRKIAEQAPRAEACASL